MRLDLHLHSLASDGSESPTRVIETAAAVSLDVIALTDHDTTEGVASAREAARYVPVEVIAGIEVSTTLGGMELHILGYFVDPSAPRLKAHETRAKSVREERMREMIRRLATDGVEVSFNDVVEAAGPTRHSLGRPHLARALVRAGYVTTISEAFDRYIGNGHTAYIPTALVTPEEGIAIILAAGGIPVWAHPHLRSDQFGSAPARASGPEGSGGVPSENPRGQDPEARAERQVGGSARLRRVRLARSGFGDPRWVLRHRRGGREAPRCRRNLDRQSVDGTLPQTLAFLALFEPLRRPARTRFLKTRVRERRS